MFDELGFVDVFRRLNDKPDQYTWWSNRGQAWKKNVGWRIDYQIATPGIAATARSESIYKAKRFSDHAPLTIDYDHELVSRLPAGVRPYLEPRRSRRCSWASPPASPSR